MPQHSRAVSTVVSVSLMIAIVVILGTVISIYTVGTSSTQPQAPLIEVSAGLSDAVDDGEHAVAITLGAGDAVRTGHLYVSGSKPLDIGGKPGDSSTPANDDHASEREKFTESSGDNPPQVGIGETWEAGETAYLDPAGTFEEVTISIYWASQPVEGVNPGTPTGEAAYKIATVTIEAPS
ncbi:type IV pilin [Halobellus sp. EA9]|uniref:type IV pilin n=1 Tax=Halobellus sp. EA9 TaxID=3421647 RepID=UPI003EBC4422